MKQIIKNTIMGILFSAGVLLPGSDFDGFPWVNILGLCFLAMAALLAQGETRRARGGNDGPYRPPS